jgi:thymidylate kinase
MHTLSNFLLTFFSILKKDGIKYCVLRNYEELPEKNIGSDIDILIDPETLILVLKTIRGIDGINVVSVNRRQHVVTLFIDGLSRSNAQGSLQIDFQIGFAWKGIPFLSVDNVLANVASHTTHSLIKKPAIHHEAIISFFSSYVVGGWIQERYQSRVSVAFHECADEISESLSPVLTPLLVRRLIQAVSNDQRDELMSLLVVVRYQLIKRQVLHSPISLIRNVWKHYVDEVKIRYTSAPLTQLCVLGVDGSGKSTVINGLLNCLGSRVKEAEVIHLKPRFSHKDEENVTIVTDPHGMPPRSAIVSVMKLITWIFQYRIKRVFHGHKNATLIIWDRYIYDVLVDPRRYRVALPKWILDLIVYSAPKIDALVVLDVPAEVAYARKPEVALEDLYLIRQGYLDLATRMPNAKVISTATAPEKSAEELLEFISMIMARKADTTLDKWERV